MDIDFLYELISDWYLILIIAVVFVSYIQKRKKRKRQFEHIIAELGGEYKRYSTFIDPIDAIEFNYKNNEARIKLTPGNTTKSPKYLELTLQVPMGFELVISKETTARRILKRIGLSSEDKVGDPWFDDEHHIGSDKSAQSMVFLQDHEKLEVLESFIIEHGISEIRIKNDMIVIKKPNFNDDDLKPSALRQYFDQLLKLSPV